MTCLCGLVLLLSNLVLAQPAASVKTSVLRTEGQAAETLYLPYIFSTEGMGTVVGLGAMRKGFLQPQMISGATIFAGPESNGAAVGVWNFRIPYTQRLYLSVIGMNGDYPRNKAYTSGHHAFDTHMARPGANDSSNQQFIQGSGYSDWSDFRLEYALPIGATSSSGMVEYQLKRGLLTSKASGGETWNPLTSGASVVILRQYNRHQSFTTEDDLFVSGKVNAISLGFLYDNTDFPINPEHGSKQYIAIHHNPGNSNQMAWQFAELEVSKYISLGSSNWARQRILALNTWLAYSPSWQQVNKGQGQASIINNPPYNEGATLGGFYRMRGYDQNRFSDKAAFYTSAEYRYTLEYNPIEEVNWLRFLKMDWAQLAFFAEAGRVAPQMDSQLFSAMKTDVGIGIRALMAGSIVRLDMAYSEEGMSGWVMIGHPF